MWLNEVGKKRKTDEEQDDDSVEEGFQLVREKFNKDGKEGREAVGVGCCSTNIWDLSELKTADISKAIFQYFYYPVNQIHHFLRCVVFYVKYVS